MTYAFFVALFLFTGQLAQYWASLKDVRNHALDMWAGEDKARQDQVVAFKQICLEGFPSKQDSKELNVVIPNGKFIDHCVEKHGYGELLKVVNQADNVLTSVAWPTSLIVDKI